MQVIYHPHAEEELIVAAEYYEEQVRALGSQFLDAVDDAVKSLMADPKRWRPVHGEVRRYLMSRFPFSLYYHVYPGRLHILAIKHHSRHPDYWRYRV